MIANKGVGSPASHASVRRPSLRIWHARQSPRPPARRSSWRPAIKRRPSSRDQLREGMIQIPGGTFRMGSDQHYPEEAPVASRHRRRLLDRSHAGDQPPVQGIRSRHRLRHVCRDPARSDILSGRVAAHAAMRARWCSRRRSRRSTCATGASGGTSPGGATGGIPTGRKSSINGLDDHPVVHVAYDDAAGLCEMGRQGAADRG